ncbi:MAG: carboxypeptidase-like regulatory domain-containing protein [Bacteroidota bacterium]
MENKLFPCRIYELPVVGGSVQISLVRDATAFLPYVDFHAPFPADFLAQTIIIEGVVYPRVIINQMKEVTLNVIKNSFGLRPLLNSAEIFFNSASGGLNIGVADMGLHQVRVAIERGDVEDLLAAGHILNLNIAHNHVILEAKGMTQAMQDALVDAFATIKTDVQTQTSLRQLRSSTTEQDMILYNDYWTTYVAPTLKAGKLIFKISSPAKAKDYTASKLIAAMRHDALQTEIHGQVTTKDGKPVKGAKVKFIPVEGGRTKTVYTDANGYYVVKGIKPTDYNQVVTKGNLVKVNPVTAVTREKILLNSVIV